MKHTSLYFIALLLIPLSVLAQQKKLDTVKVEMYTSEERDNLQYWFHQEIDSMKMTDSVSNLYFAIINKYGYKISRLDDKDQPYGKEEIDRRMDSLINLQNKELKSLLNEEQYQLHQENYADIIYSIKARLKKKK